LLFRREPTALNRFGNGYGERQQQRKKSNDINITMMGRQALAAKQGNNDIRT